MWSSRTGRTSLCSDLFRAHNRILTPVGPADQLRRLISGEVFQAFQSVYSSLAALARQSWRRRCIVTILLLVFTPCLDRLEQLEQGQKIAFVPGFLPVPQSPRLARTGWNGNEHVCGSPAVSCFFSNLPKKARDPNTPINRQPRKGPALVQANRYVSADLPASRPQELSRVASSELGDQACRPARQGFPNALQSPLLRKD